MMKIQILVVKFKNIIYMSVQIVGNQTFFIIKSKFKNDSYESFFQNKSKIEYRIALVENQW
ncbi:hypothetical protein COE53_06460 [Bacillus sp. AFS029533]|uniref:Ribosomal protein L32 n=1 Tax=Gottfriedia luciferensis TaxID=178774 RepID=A0ABX2ZVH9_9BACI|nr:hypothetical protein BED47_03840 [Gottfriedia luciferensis]PGZ93337.1 hypothetical protein COE53_06460 [Bacillus sp. AFS029533]